MLAVWGTIPIHLPQKVVLLAGSHGEMSQGGMCGNQHLWMRRRGSNPTEPHRGGSCIAGQKDTVLRSSYIGGLRRKKMDHP